MENINFISDERDDVVDRDHHLDFDMFDYIYSLVCTIDDYSVVLNPFGGPLKKFDIKEDGYQVYTNGNSGVVVESYYEEDFETLVKICDMYKFSIDGPVAHKDFANDRTYYALTINVPMVSDTYPAMLEDYFDDIGVSLDNVMPKKWVTAYRNKLAKLEKEADAEANDMQVEKLYQKHVTEAWRRGDIELTDHFQNLVDELKRENLTFKRNLLRRRFLDEFEDLEDDSADEIAVPVEVELF
jgi:hypothetical protein